MKNHCVEEAPPSSTSGKVAVTYPWLDWIRFGAALQVLFVHSRDFTFVEYSGLDSASKNKFVALWFASTRTGLESVLGVFVLSGFLVGGKVIERVANGTFDWRSYAVDRFSRIYTPLIPALAFSLLIDIFFKSSPSFKDYLGNLFSLQGVFFPPIHTIGSIWSLSYEIWFYILAGSLGTLLLTRPKSSIAMWVVLLASLAIFCQLSAVLLFCWFLGSIIYLYPKTALSRVELASGFVLFILGSGIIQLSSSSHFFHSFNQYPIFGAAGQLILSSGIALTLRNLCTITTTVSVETTLARLGTKLAAFSYTLYLIHYPILVAMEKMGYSRQPSISKQTLLLYITRIIASIIMSYLFYWIFERNTPLIRNGLRKRFANEPQSIRTMV